MRKKNQQIKKVISMKQNNQNKFEKCSKRCNLQNLSFKGKSKKNGQS